MTTASDQAAFLLKSRNFLIVFIIWTPCIVFNKPIDAGRISRHRWPHQAVAVLLIQWVKHTSTMRPQKQSFIVARIFFMRWGNNQFLVYSTFSGLRELLCLGLCNEVYFIFWVSFFLFCSDLHKFCQLGSSGLTIPFDYLGEWLLKFNWDVKIYFG